MAPNLTISPPVSLKIQTLNSQQLEANKITTERPDPLYRPGDIIPAVIEVHKYKQFEAVSLHSSLIGTNDQLTHPFRSQTPTDTHPRRNASMDPPQKPPRHLPDNHPHTPQPKRRLLAIHTLNQHDQSRKQALNTNNVRLARTCDRMQKQIRHQRQATTFMRKRFFVSRPMGSSLQTAAHRVLPASHPEVPHGQRDGNPDDDRET